MTDSRRGKGRLVADRRYPKKPAKKPAAKKPAPVRRKPARPKVKRGGIVGFFVGVVSWVFRFILRLFLRAGIVVALLVAGWVGITYTTLPEVSDALDGRARGSVQLLDRDGVAFAWRGDQFGGVVTADTVSPHLRNAVVATEDRRFYRHFGISPRGIASAVRINLSEGRGPLSGHGGSTITQQTAKLLCLGVVYDPDEWKNEAEYVADCRRGSLARKAKEAIYALAMEAKYTKDEILSIYLNRAYMGGGAYGAAAAAERYFSKPASALTPQEGAMIAGLLTAPSSLAPTSNLERSQARAATVLRLMNEQGYLTDAETRAAQANPATLSDKAKTQTGGYFADWVMQSGPDFFTRDTTEDVIISTTLDQRIQKAAEDAIKTIFTTKVREGSKAQAAIVVMSADGAVRGMVGGRQTNVSGVFNRATQAKRQTGSAFKPFVYATALELGYSPYDRVQDEPFCMNIPGSGQWCPENYSRDYFGSVTLVDALAKSLNIPAVKVSESVGRDLVRRVSEDFGIESPLTDTPALALGASEASLLEMTGAYAGILNGGSSVTPYGLEELRLVGEPQPLMGSGGGIGERVINEDAARQLIWMMERVVSQGTGGRAKLSDRQVAGKTGTTQAARDAWFIGFTADYVAGVWMGYDDNTPLTGVTGSGLPAEIWHEAMRRVHEGLPVRPLPMIEPKPPRQVAQPKPQEQPAPQRDRGGNALENALNQLLRDILGGN
ncbi:transglycosylase domain-containing protein [Marivita geojedonensis]|uniref:peptidoglycan glycosyltransferase n=1 Tax=Marivita geojedonensis TaxID=1123756 RepID=A0A1X4NQH8_9RHOB|nr:PBP1A family penicillin-binding protein [Marivita geojedonensis]OSQ53214.1 glycosyl transferase [Marivita geojedonensis]PRY81841.1 1A family penicillin-binding protein [Marivita geojedonensis]